MQCPTLRPSELGLGAQTHTWGPHHSPWPSCRPRYPNSALALLLSPLVLAAEGCRAAAPASPCSHPTRLPLPQVLTPWRAYVVPAMLPVRVSACGASGVGWGKGEGLGQRGGTLGSPSASQPSSPAGAQQLQLPGGEGHRRARAQRGEWHRAGRALRPPPRGGTHGCLGTSCGCSPGRS